MEKIHWWRTDIDGEAERTSVMDCMSRRCFSLGPVVKELESALAERLGVSHVVLTLNGSSAITLALLGLGVGPGDHIITTDLTWIATGQSIALLGAQVDLVDTRADIPLIDVEQVRKKISTRTKAIIPVHLNGRACDIRALSDLAASQGIALVEDSCKAFLSMHDGKLLGTFGTAGCFSFGLVSLLSLGYGGGVATNNGNLCKTLRSIRDHGVVRGAHEAYACLGFNFKISDLLASLGVAQLPQLEAKRQKVLEVYRLYQEGLADLDFIEVLPVASANGEVPLLTEVVSPERERLIPHLAQHGIEAQRFHLPLHHAEYFKSPGEFPNASKFSAEGFILPCGPSQPLDNVRRTIDTLRKWRTT